MGSQHVESFAVLFSTGKLVFLKMTEPVQRGVSAGRRIPLEGWPDKWVFCQLGASTVQSFMDVSKTWGTVDIRLDAALGVLEQFILSMAQTGLQLEETEEGAKFGAAHILWPCGVGI